jgi:hypothetical protein
VKIALFPTFRHTFRLASIRTVDEPVLGSVPVEVPRKGGCCHLRMTISNGSRLSPQSPERGDSLKGSLLQSQPIFVGKLLKFR